MTTKLGHDFEWHDTFIEDIFYQDQIFHLILELSEQPPDYQMELEKHHPHFPRVDISFRNCTLEFADGSFNELKLLFEKKAAVEVVAQILIQEEKRSQLSLCLRCHETGKEEHTFINFSLNYDDSIVI